MSVFDATQASGVTGATLSQIEHLVKSGVVMPVADAPRRGMSRQFSVHNLITIAVAVRFIGLGVPVRVVRTVLATLRDDGGTHVVLSNTGDLPRFEQLGNEEVMTALQRTDGFVYVNIGRIAQWVGARAAMVPSGDTDPGAVRP